MIYIRIVLIVFVCISSTLNVFGQHKKDTIVFSQDEIVRKIHTTEKYVGIKVDNKKLRKGRGILYNRSGEKIFEYEEDTNRILDFIPNEKYNQIIIINKIWDYPVQYKDELVALDIDTRSINWKARSIASVYLISPDGKSLMTGSGVGGYEIKNEFGIINLRDGSLIPVDFDLGDDYYAIWFDTQRVILYTREWEMKRNELFFEETEKYQKEKNKISKDRADLYFKYRNDSTISKQDYTIQNQKLLNKKDSITKKYDSKFRAQPIMVGDTAATQFVGRPYDFSTKSLNFIMYNIVTNEIEYAKSYDPDDNILTNLRYCRMESINIDENKNIYVVDYKDKFHQLDKKFNVNWSVELAESDAVYRVIKVINSDSIFFVVENREKNEYSLISKKGEKQLLNAADNPILSDRLKKPSISHIIDLKSGTEYDVEKNLLIFKE